MSLRPYPALDRDADGRVAFERTTRRQTALRRLALLCAALVLTITSLSAFIRLSKAGLSCTEASPQVQAAGPSEGTESVRPTCYGQGQRELQKGLPATAGESQATVVARLVHRVVASIALLLVITMAMVCFTSRPLLWREGRVALVLLALALFLAVLGRWSSNARVPATAIGNLLGGFAMLALCWRLARSGRAPASRRLRRWAAVGVALLVCEVALGSLLSASFGAGSCDGLFDCIAASRGVPSSTLNPWREPVLAATPPINASAALAQSAHRLVAIAVAAVVLVLGVAVLRERRRIAGTLLLALLAAELCLGLLMTPAASLALALAHNLVAALLLATATELA